MKIIKEKIVACVFLLSNVFIASQMLNAQGPFGGGLGIPGNPYLIYDKGHLEELADSVLSPTFSSKYYYYKLTNDITDSVKIPIGYDHLVPGPPPPLPGLPPPPPELRIARFQGSFDGDGHHIVLAIKMPPNPTREDSLMYRSGGVFGSITGSTVIKNVIVSGYVETRIAGGIVGEMVGGQSISNCINMATIMGQTAGGIVGALLSGSSEIIDNCLNIGNVTSTYDNSSIGGILGVRAGTMYLANTIIKNCSNIGIIRGANVFILPDWWGTGGIVGHGDRTSEINVINCINIGILEGSGNVDAIIGYEFPY